MTSHGGGGAWMLDGKLGNPIGSMEKWYIYLHEWLIFMVNVGK